MSSFQFKGTPVNTILTEQQNNDVNNKYPGLNYTGYLSYSGWSMFRPLPVGYQIDGVDISTTATAKYETIYGYKIFYLKDRPAGANGVRYSLVASGGGGGGGGAMAWNQGSGSYAVGGSGGYGGAGGRTGGEILFNSYPNMNPTNSHVYVGPGGAGGAGAVPYGFTTKHSEAPVGGGTGTAGSTGGGAYIILRDNNNSHLIYKSAGGGYGGNGGGGGVVPQYTYRTAWTLVHYGSNGNTGSTGGSGPMPSGYYPHAAGGGAGGAGGNIHYRYEGYPGSSGTAGRGSLVWLWN